MKKLLCLLIALPILCSSFAQTEIKPKTNKIKTKKIQGYELTLTEDISIAADSWTNYLKTLGKYKNLLIYQSVAELNIDFPGDQLYALSDKNSNNIILWLGSKDISEPEETDFKKIFTGFEEQLKKDKAQKGVDEAERAVGLIEKRQNKASREMENLESKKGYNEKELSRLERLIEENKLEFESLKSQIENKKLEQDSLVVALEKAKGVLEVKKEKLKSIE